MSEHTRLFDLADRLKELRDEKKALEQQLKELSARLDETDEALASAMLAPAATCTAGASCAAPTRVTISSASSPPRSRWVARATQPVCPS